MTTKKLTIATRNKIGHIRPEIYGHFSEHLGRCIYQGIYVGEDSSIPNVRGIRTDVVEALKEIGIPVLRWPGGCFADEYHWKDGIGPKASRKKMVNTHWGGVTEDNSFGTHEFMDLCEQLGCEPYISGNLGSGTVQEMSEWVEYMTSDAISPMTELRAANGHALPWKVTYFGVGNESWGCGGNMTAEYYANLYRHYQTYCRNYGDNHLFKIACGPNGEDYEWTDKLMQMVKPWHTSAISLHYYTVVNGNWAYKGKAAEFTNTEYYQTISGAQKIERIIDRHLAIMHQYDPEHKIGLAVDEWGNWFEVEEGTNPGFLFQQNTMRDAIVAALSLNIFNQRADRIVMANIAQVVNVLQSVLLTEGEKMIKTPTWYVYRMFRAHQNGEAVLTALEDSSMIAEGERISALSCSASEAADGTLTITISNADLTESYALDTLIDETYRHVSGTILTGACDAHNTFEDSDRVHTYAFTGAELSGQSLTITVPPCSVIALTLTK